MEPDTLMKYGSAASPNHPVDATTADNRLTLTSSLPLGRYYWKVSIRSGDAEIWSDVGTFDVARPPGSAWLVFKPEQRVTEVHVNTGDKKLGAYHFEVSSLFVLKLKAWG